MRTRIIVGVVLSAPMLAVWIAGGAWLLGVLYLALIFSAYEMISSFARAGRKVHVIPCAAYIIALPIGLAVSATNGILIALFVSIFALFLQLILTTDTNMNNMLATVFTIVYPLLLLSTLVALMTNGGERGRVYILLIIVVAVMTDTAAYFTGSFAGKTKLIPAISPKKTVEGSVGGVVGGVVGALLLYLILGAFMNTQAPLGTYLLVGLFGSFVGQVGDLAASLVKRMAGIKDYGTIFPGHGGVLDRMDSIMAISAMVYIFWSASW